MPKLNYTSRGSATSYHGPSNLSFFVPCRCKTKMGERLLGRWLRQPLVDKLKLEARLDMVEYLKDDPMLRGSLQVSP